MEDGVHECYSFFPAFGGDFGFEEDVSAVDFVPFPVDELYDVESEFGLDDFGYFAFFFEVECDGGEFGYESCLGVPAEVSPSRG